ncbi:MAG: DNA repair protein RecO [Lachnospiraceae bacterium]|nr:DNA repair protein RecO [Lachnospiraceae bacterium]
MAAPFETPGMILKSTASADYDRRVVILTKDYGKISAFARGARRQTNHLSAATDLFIFADFKLYPGKSAYTLTDAAVRNYFEELRSDFEASLYGMYFLEAAEYNTRENNDESDILKLLYQSCRALVHPAYDNRLVRSIFELKLIMLSGCFHRDDYDTSKGYGKTALYTLDFLNTTAPEKLFTFSVEKKVIDELADISAKERKRYGDGHKFKSEDMLSLTV